MSEKYFPFDSPDLYPPLNDEWAAKRKLADATRALIANLVTCTNDTEEILAISEVVQAQADKLASSRQILGRAEYEAQDEQRYGTLSTIAYELNPLDGKCNPLAPPIMVWMDDEAIYGSVNMGWHYEGPPNSVHGGFVAALFDQFLGLGQKITGQPGVTGSLTTRYHKPTPLNTELKLTGKVVSIEGRKNTLRAEIWANGSMTASCEGLFISIDRETYMRMKRMQESTQSR
ncbi:thioesterase superfamily protein [Sinobacterium caligoides]|uniref:Acyl-coenzyme A thioesterase THEM4 n=1 Tax=Sinobacterium caligoides TaxID=933926 RepID=A0A3N2DQG1_9GAMM|nr:PaaI family thioesterase [Sinobacterium caligoides]ROS01912.1 thioesterase superfamily protein [Sinobacterium caligoides]